MNKKTILSATNIHKSFYTPKLLTVLNGISLQLMEGETVAIMGKSGEGKSTLLHILGTLEKPCQGEVTICGKNTDFSNLRSQHIGFIFQSFHLLEEYTVLENVLMPAKIARKNTSPSSSFYKRGMDLLCHVGLENRAHFLAKSLSGGEKQRACIARSLCNDPDLILADEPSGNLDQSHSEAIHELLINSARNFNKALIVVTHDAQLAKLCNRMLILKEGIFQCTS